ncbi:MAG TPA: hypothetical protein VGL72_09785 [Bryobacteraceae bacterium]
MPPRRAQCCSALILLLPAAYALDRPRVATPPREVTITLLARADNPATEVVNFGLPLPPGFLDDAALVRAFGENGTELEIAARSLEPWRIDGKDGTIRALQIQFRADFHQHHRQQVRITFDHKRTRSNAHFVPVQQTLIEPDGLKGPRVLALIPAKWLCDSWLVGPQVPASESGLYKDYDRLVDKNFPGSLHYIASTQYDHWLFDRTTCWYKMYVRTGEQRFLEAAYQAAHFVRTHTRMEGPDAGAFNPKGSADLKYVYPRAQHIHYLLTGDERSAETGKIMAKLILKNWDPVYNRGFWTPRHEGYGLLGVVHGWELTGDLAYWKKAREYADALYQLQNHPPDGRPPDGSFRENWARYDPSEAKFEGATSAWMMAILLDPMFHYWTLTGDDRIPEMVVKWCDFLDRQGLQPDGRSAFYVINCFAADPGQLPSTVNGDMTRHDTEMSYEFAMGIYFSQDPARRAVYKKRFDKLFSVAIDKDFNQTARAFNWAFQASPQLVYFMQHPGGKP